MTIYPLVTLASAQAEGDLPKGRSFLLTHRSCRKCLKRPWVVLSPNTAARLPPRVCLWLLLRKPHVTPPAGALAGSVSALPTDSWSGRGPFGTHNCASTKKPAPNTPRRTTWRSPHNSVTGNPPNPTATSHTSNRLLGANDADTVSRSPAPTRSGPYTGNTSGREPQVPFVKVTRELLRKRLSGAPERSERNRFFAVRSPVPTTRARKNVP